MLTTNLRKVGGSVMLAGPPALLSLLHLQAGSTVAVAVEDGRLIVAPSPRPRYTLADLLDAGDYAHPPAPEDRDWVEGAPVGGELL